MSPFRSRAQAKAAFSGGLGPKMKADATEWADSTPGGIAALPERVAAVGKRIRRVLPANAKVIQPIKPLKPMK